MFNALAYGGNPMMWAIVLVVIVLFFGANKLPEIFRGLGSGMKEFKKGLSEEDEKKDEPKKDEDKKSGAAA